VTVRAGPARRRLHHRRLDLSVEAGVVDDDYRLGQDQSATFSLYIFRLIRGIALAVVPRVLAPDVAVAAGVRGVRREGGAQKTVPKKHCSRRRGKKVAWREKERLVPSATSTSANASIVDERKTRFDS